MKSAHRYVANFAWSFGPLGWLVPSEIQPAEIRTAGMAFATAINMAFTFIIGQAFLKMMCHMQQVTHPSPCLPFRAAPRYWIT